MLTFATKFKFSFKATENNACLINLRVECPVIFRRPAGTTGTLSSLKTTMLENTLDTVSVDVTINSVLVACDDSVDLGSACVRHDPAAIKSYALNDKAKYELYITDENIATTYYLKKYKVSMKTGDMAADVDFTGNAIQPAVRKGSMIFTTTMAIVGDQVTVTASATLSLTARRMMADAVKGTLGFDTATITAANSGVGSYLISMMMMLGLAIILL
jgi:hypothetical protein